MATYEVSNDGKTVTVKGKTYSIRSFKKQFSSTTRLSGMFDSQDLKPGLVGSANAGHFSPKIKQVSAKTADEAKTKADKKASARAARSVKAASKPVASSSADAARAAAAKRALATAPSARTAAQKAAIARTTGGIAGSGAKNVAKIYRNIGGGSLGGMFGTKNR